MRVKCTASHLIMDQGRYRRGDIFEIREEDYPRVRTAVIVLPDPVPVALPVEPTETPAPEPGKKSVKRREKGK